MINYEKVDLSEQNILSLEKLRFEVYDYKNLNPDKTYFFFFLINGNILPFAAYENGLLIGGCYVSKTFETLFIDQLFIAKDYQDTPEHIGTNLLKYVLANKKLCEDFFNTKFNFSYLDNSCSKSFYENLGYKENNNEMMSKRI